MISIYRTSLACLRLLWPAILLCAVLTPIADRYLGNTGMTLLLYCVNTGLAYVIFRHILTRDGGPTFPPALPAFAGIMAALLLAVFALGWWLPDPVLLFRPSFTTPWTFQALKFTSFALFYLPYWAVLSLFGVVLAAAANGDLAGLGARLAKSQLAIARIGWQMLIAPGVFLGIGTIWVIPGFYAQVGELIMPGHYLLSRILTSAILIPMISFGAILTAMILCDAYRRMPPAPADSAA